MPDQRRPRRPLRELAALAAVVATLAVLTVAAAPADASLTAAGGSIAGSAVNATWDGGVYTCPAVALSATVSASQLSASLDFSPRTTCYELGGGSSVHIVCRGPWTLTATSSIAGVRAAGTVSLDTGSQCSFQILITRCSPSVVAGPQGPFAGWTFDQATQRLTLTFGSLRVTTRGCYAATTFTATFAVSPTSLTVS